MHRLQLDSYQLTQYGLKQHELKWVKYPKYSLYWQKQTDMDSKEILDSIDEFFRTADEVALAEARAVISVKIEDDISLELSYYSDTNI